MSDNKFIERLKGKETAKSVLEVKNQATKLSFANMPQGTSNAIDVFSDHRGNATAVLNGTTNWKISNSNLLLATTVSGDGQDFLSTYSVSGTGLWVNASYTFPSTGDPRHPIAMVFNPSTKWVLKVCGDNLIVDGGSTVDFTMLVKIGTANVYSKNFTVRESAGQFSKEFVIDFGEANLDIVKAGGLSTLTVQLLCGTANASARIYNGMSVLTCLQRKVDASAVSNNGGNVEDVLNGSMIPVDYFSNPEFINQIEDGEEAYAVFTRDGDNVDLSGWTPKDEIAKKEEIIVKSDTIPTASADLVGAIYQYAGETNQIYEHGYIYECKLIPADTLVFTPETVACSWANLSAFLQTQTPNYNSVTNGTMTYSYAGDIWRLDAKDAQGNIVTSYQQYTGDWEQVGFTFTGSFPDGTVVSFVRNTADTYAWERIDVQPGGSRGRFLALWDCVTGLPESNPAVSPFVYKTGDYYVVGNVGTTNYKPSGTEYVVGTPSTDIETKDVAIDDTYFFDGTSWHLQSNSNKTMSFSNIAGSPYDNTNLGAALNAKQNTITGAATTITSSNLTANRAVISNASGKVAVSTTTSTELGYVHGVTSAIQTQLNGKQATLVSGTNIKTVNNNSLLGSGNVDIDALPSQTGHAGEFLTTDGTTASWAPGQADIDNSTITKNTNDELQAVATINANTATGATNLICDWNGPLAEYNAQNVKTLHPDWICYITDDVSGGDSVYTKSEVDNGFVALTGNQTVNGTKTFTSSVNRTAELSPSGTNLIKLEDSNGQGNVSLTAYYTGGIVYNRVLCRNLTSQEYVYLDVQAFDSGDGGVRMSSNAIPSSNDSSEAIPTTSWVMGHGVVVATQAPTSSNNYTWYRKYSDGWVEQGGIQTGSLAVNYGSEANFGTITLPVPMANALYFATASCDGYVYLINQSKTTTQYTPKLGAYTTNRTVTCCTWYICGRAAS